MRRILSALGIVGCLVLAAEVVDAEGEPAISVQDVGKALQARHPVKDVQRPGDFQFAPDTKIVALKLPRLTEGLAGTRFYRTELETGHLEYPRVEVVVMVRRVGNELTVHECFSPVFTGSSPDFLAQFRGLRTRTDVDRKQIGAEIGQLFQSITYHGGLQNPRLSRGRYTVDLMHGDSVWRPILIEFDSDGTLKRVEMRDTSRRGHDEAGKVFPKVREPGKNIPSD